MKKKRFDVDVIRTEFLDNKVSTSSFIVYL